MCYNMNRTAWKVVKNMKKGLRFLGIALLVCGIVLSLICNQAIQDKQPRKYSSGYVTNGVYTETQSGYFGGDSDFTEGMNILRGLGYFVTAAGGVMTIVSFFVKESECNY